MKNIAVPGVFPLVLAVFLLYGFARGSAVFKRTGDRKAKASKWLCLAGALIFFMIAILQLLEMYGISFR